MVTLLTDSVKSLMSQYTLEMDANSLNKDLICTICKKIMINAYQSYCGCHYCHGCIVAFLGNGDKYCPGGKYECKDELLVMEKNVTLNPMLNKNIFRAKVHCPNKPCPCITELPKIAEHLRVCSKQSMECPFSLIGCENEGASKENILVHLHDDVCTHSKLIIELINNLKNEVNGLKEDFAMSKSELSTLRKDLEGKELQIGKLRREMVDQRRSMIKQEKEMDNQRKETNELRKEIDGLRGESEKREIIMEDVKEVMTLKKEIVEVREYSRIIENTAERLQREFTKYRIETRSTLTKMKEETEKKESTAIMTQSMKDVRARVDKLAETVSILNVGTNTKVAVGQLSFTVDKFSTKKTSEEEILSPYFYSHTNGYKLQLQVYINGRGDARRTHLSLFVVICKGEYDGLLQWPCRHTFTLSITNQRDGGTHASRTVNYATTTHNKRYSFDKPINKDNVGYGWDTFVSHVDLQSKVGLVVDDSVIIRCVVSAPP